MSNIALGIVNGYLFDTLTQNVSEAAKKEFLESTKKDNSSEAVARGFLNLFSEENKKKPESKPVETKCEKAPEVIEAEIMGHNAVIEKPVEKKVEPKVEKSVQEVTKPEVKIEVKPTVVEKPLKEETSTEVVQAEVVDSKGDVITMQDRRTCPVKIVPVEQQSVKVKLNKPETTQEDEHQVQHLIAHLNSIGVNFTKPVKMPTGLYEFELLQLNGTPVRISVDVNGLLYSNDFKFYIGHMEPSMEYTTPAIILAPETVLAVVKNEPINPRFLVSDSLVTLNAMLDLQTLKEKNEKKRAETFETAAKIISDLDIYNGIIKAACGEPFRFAFARYVSPKEFSMVSSKRNLSSNLSDDKLVTSKEIWINLKNGEYKLEGKSCRK